MESRFIKVLVPIACSIGLVMFLYCGLLMGFQQKWFEMCFLFIPIVFAVDSYVGFLLNIKIATCFKQLEDLYSGKPNSMRSGYHFIEYVVSFFTIVLCVILVSLSWLVGHRQHWLMLGVLLLSLLITVFVSSGVMITLRIKTCSRRLKQLISNDKEGNANKEQPGD